MTRIEGSIGPTTVAEFEKALTHVPGQSDLVITLDSLGGYVASALQIGRLIRNAQGRTAVEENATCASACVLIFAAGLARVVDLPESGLLDLPPGVVAADHRPAAIGIHRPTLVDVSGGRWTWPE